MIEAECHWILKHLDGKGQRSILDIGGGTHYFRLRSQPYIAYNLYRPLLLQKNQIAVLERSIVQRKKDVLFSIPLEVLSRVTTLFPPLHRYISSFVPLANTIFGNCKHIPLSDNVYDVIFLLSLLEHVTEPLNALLEAIRVLKKGGLAFISVPEICPYHPSPIDTGLRMGSEQIASFVRPYLTILAKDTLSDEPSCHVSILFCKKE